MKACYKFLVLFGLQENFNLTMLHVGTPLGACSFAYIHTYIYQQFYEQLAAECRAI